MSHEEGPALSVLIVPEGSRSTRTFRFTQRRLRFLLTVAALAAVGLALMAGTWWYLAIRSVRVTELETRVAELQAESERVADLALQLEAIEERYAGLAEMLGATGDTAQPLVALPPPRSLAGSRRAPDRDVPSSWPLTEPGFVTQALLADTTGGHPGLDIAIPTGSYVRASASGVVAEVGEDPIYGRFVALEHAQGYRTVYGHASEILVASGEQVLQNEIIALSGSTGRSTAPHLHFEVWQNGDPVDPLSMVDQP